MTIYLNYSILNFIRLQVDVCTKLQAVAFPIGLLLEGQKSGWYILNLLCKNDTLMARWMIQFSLQFLKVGRSPMQNATIELIHNHGSVRNFKLDPVPVDVIETIISAGQRAATSSNLQMFSVVVTTDQEEREQMRSYCGGQSHISQAPVFLTWCADLSRLDRICRNLGYSHQAGYVENFLLAVVDAAIAAQNAALAAESLGLGFCYIGAIRNNPKEVISMLELPKLVFPLVGMTIGWPVEPPRIRPRLATK